MEKRLGKGLGALIPEDTSKGKQKIDKIKTSEIAPNQLQPRKRFGQEKMEDLLSSIKEKGVIQPVLVRLVDGGYELIAGERRWRAAQELGVEEIPAIVLGEIDDANSLEISLIENIQREELNAIEEANAYRELIGRFEYTLDKVGQMVGKDKTTVSNSLRLLNLSEDIRAYVEEGKLSTGHAKALLSVTNEHLRAKIAKQIVRKGLSVREAEQLVKTKTETTTKTRKHKDPEITRIEEQLQHKLGTKVNVHQGKKRGRIEIQYYSNDDLARLLRTLLQ